MPDRVVLPATQKTLRLHAASAVVLWAVAYALQTAEFSADHMSHPGAAAWRRAGVIGMGVLLSGGLFLINGQLRQTRFAARALIAATTSIVAAGLYTLTNHALFYMVNPLWGGDTLWGMTYLLRMTFWVFAAWNALYFAIEYDVEARDKALRLTAAEALAVDAQNRMLRYQINPHFLFNTLNALSALILDRRPAEAERMVLALSAFLRHSLSKDISDLIPLGEELDIQTEYLAIEQIRFGDRLTFIDAAPERLRHALVPNMILQPLMENTVKHGVGRTSASVTLTVRAAEDEGALVLTVSDDAAGDGPKAPHLGVGLENVRRRLESAFGAAGRFACAGKHPSGFEVILRMPLMFA